MVEQGYKDNRDKMILLSSYHIIVRDLILTAQIGMSEEERSCPQMIRLSVNLSVMPPQSVFNDQTDLILNYDTVLSFIRHSVHGQIFHLLETLGEVIAQKCLKLPHVKTVNIAIEKVRIEPDSTGVGIVLEYKSIQ